MYHVISTPDCRWCDMAKKLLEDRGLDYSEDLIVTQEQKKAFVRKGYRTVPQVFEGETHIGGYEDLFKHLSAKS